MKNILLIALVVAVILGLGGVFVLVGGKSLFAECTFIPKPLEGESLETVESAARQYLCTQVPSLKDSARVRSSRFISPKEYMSFFGGTDALCQDQKLALVIYQGDFKFANRHGALPESPTAKFVSVLMDLRVGEPTILLSSPTGAEFRKILGDNSLPKLKTKLVPPPDTLRKCGYDEIAPTLAPPS
jgi:hypothetical protein